MGIRRHPREHPGKILTGLAWSRRCIAARNACTELQGAAARRGEWGDGPASEHRARLERVPSIVLERIEAPGRVGASLSHVTNVTVGAVRGALGTDLAEFAAVWRLASRRAGA